MLLFLCIYVMEVIAQNYPTEWDKYTSDGYIFDIQSDYNVRNLSETQFKDYLLNIARTNLAKQIQLKITDAATLDKSSVNGNSSILYRSSTEFYTDVNLYLVKTLTTYDASLKYGSVIAYIDRIEAYYYHKHKIEAVLSKAESSYESAGEYIKTGFKSKAREELESLQKELAKNSGSYDWLAILGKNEEAKMLTDRQSRLESTIKQLLSDLQYGIKIHLKCSSVIFGDNYSELDQKLKGVLAADGCSFVQNREDADWEIILEATSREYNQTNYGNNKFYFAYVDATFSIYKVITSQQIYENNISVKGGHTLGYKNAAMAAYNDLSSKLGEIILNTINK